MAMWPCHFAGSAHPRGWSGGSCLGELAVVPDRTVVLVDPIRRIMPRPSPPRVTARGRRLSLAFRLLWFCRVTDPDGG
jgi:hypothetical protein